MGFFNNIKKTVEDFQERSKARKEQELKDMPKEIERLKMQQELEKEKIKLNQIKQDSKATNTGGLLGLGNVINEDALKQTGKGGVKITKTEHSTFGIFNEDTILKDARKVNKVRK